MRNLMLTALFLAAAFAPSKGAAQEIRLAVNTGSLVPYEVVRSGTEFRLLVPAADSITISSSMAYRDATRGSQRVLVVNVPSEQEVEILPAADGRSLSIRLASASGLPKVAGATPSTPAPAPAPTPAPPTDAKPAEPAPVVPAAAVANPVIDNFKKYSLDMPVPPSPAFVLLGLSGETATRPTTARQLVTSLESGVDKTGKLKGGIAIDSAPFQLTLGTDLTLDGYKRLNPALRSLLNTQLSLATTSGAGDADKVKRVGLGLNIPIYDAGDPRLDTELVHCLNTKAPPILTMPMGIDESGNPATQATVTASPAGLKACYDEARARSRSRTAWTLGFGQSWTSTTGDLNDAKKNTRGLWTSYSYGFEHVELLKGKAQLVLSVRQMDDEIVADPLDAAKLVSQDSRAAAVQFRLAADTLAGAIEYSRQNLRIDSRPTDRVNRLAIGLDYQLDKNLWLSASVGGEGGRKNGESRNFVFGGIKYGRYDAPQFQPN